VDFPVVLSEAVVVVEAVVASRIVADAGVLVAASRTVVAAVAASRIAADAV